jgi:hypothetical protein
LNLPYTDGYDKRRALEDAYRVLDDGGILSIENIRHDYMRKSWVYEYFPGAIEIDRKGFIPSDLLYAMLTEIGFRVDARIRIEIRHFLFREIIQEAENRDMSELNLISEDEYAKGINRMREDSRTGRFFVGYFALLDYSCTRRSTCGKR